MTYLQCNNS